jgi:hypothetical protein
MFRKIMTVAPAYLSMHFSLAIYTDHGVTMGRITEISGSATASKLAMDRLAEASKDTVTAPTGS